MRRLLHALIVGTVAAAVLVGSARAEALQESARISQRTTLVATVVKALGAAVRVAPAVDAAFLTSAACGEIWPVQKVQGGWVKVLTSAGPGWVSGGRVVVSNVPASVDCAGFRPVVVGESTMTTSGVGCTSLHSRPSDEAEMLACVGAGHTFTIVDGPFDSGADEWFKVTSTTTGTGWAPATSLI